MFRRKRPAFSGRTRELALPLLAGGAAIAIADIGRRVFRHTRIFCPSRIPLHGWNPAAYGIPDGAAEEHWIETPDGEILHAWYCRAKEPVASGVFCHGNTGNLTIIADVIPHLLSAGFNVLLFDYRGFGRSSGHVSYRGIIADGITASRFHERLRPQHLPALLYGYSLGGGVAAQVIRRHRFDALILQSTFTSLPAITRALFPRIPLHLFSGNLFDTLSVVRRLDVPLLVIHGTDDEVCPCWMAHEIYDACSAPKRIHCIAGGLHKDLFIRDPEAIISTLVQFLGRITPASQVIAIEEPSRIERWIDPALRSLRRMARRKSSVIASPAR